MGTKSEGVVTRVATASKLNNAVRMQSKSSLDAVALYDCTVTTNSLSTARRLHISIVQVALTSVKQLGCSCDCKTRCAESWLLLLVKLHSTTTFCNKLRCSKNED